MEATFIAFALGAGTVLVVKHGKRTRRTVARAIGWAAEQAGFVSGRVAEGIAEARRIARERYRHGREANAERLEVEHEPSPSVGPTSPRSDVSLGSNGQPRG
jgi:hypothetical protein